MYRQWQRCVGWALCWSCDWRKLLHQLLFPLHALPPKLCRRNLSFTNAAWVPTGSNYERLCNHHDQLVDIRRANRHLHLAGIRLSLRSTTRFKHCGRIRTDFASCMQCGDLLRGCHSSADGVVLGTKHAHCSMKPSFVHPEEAQLQAASAMPFRYHVDVSSRRLLMEGDEKPGGSMRVNEGLMRLLHFYQRDCSVAAGHNSASPHARTGLFS